MGQYISGGQYDGVFYVKSKGGADVAAKFLKDNSGNYIIDPNTCAPYIVPANYNPDATIQKYSALYEEALANPDVSYVATMFGNLVAGFRANFPGSLEPVMNSN